MTDTPDSDALTLQISGLELKITPPFTNRELHLVKQIAGVRAGELADALMAGDSDLLVALAHVALRRTGRVRPTVDELWELGAGEINVVVPPELEDETAAPADPTAAGGDAGANGSPATIPGSPGSPTMERSFT